MLTILKLREDAIDTFKSRYKELGMTNFEAINDLIHEVTDNIIPAYTNEILEVALSKLEFATFKSELGPAYGNDTPINHIISNIYEYISDELIDFVDTTY